MPARAFRVASVYGACTRTAGASIGAPSPSISKQGAIIPVGGMTPADGGDACPDLSPSDALVTYGDSTKKQAEWLPW